MGLLMHKGKSYGGGLTRLLDMLDVNISNPSNGDLIQYNSTNGKWENSADVWKTMAKNGAHNYFYYDLGFVKANHTSGTWNGNAYTKDGITYTFNADYSITIQGQHTGSSYTSIALCGRTYKNYKIVAGDYIFSSEYGNANVFLTIGTGDTGDGSTGSWVELATTKNGESDFTVGEKYCGVTITVTQGTNISTAVTLKPMIRLASDHNTDYTPYAPTNRDCMSYSTNAKLGAHNLLNVSANTNTTNGITFTVNSDKSITVNGKATATTYLDLTIYSRQIFPAGTYKWRGCPAGGSAGTYNTFCRTTDTGSAEFGLDTGNGNTFSISASKEIKMFITIVNGTTVNNLTFYPTITIAEDTDTAYTPYAKTNRELTEDTKIETFTLTPYSTNGVTGSATLIKCGKVCVVNGYFTLSSALTTNKKLFEFPSAANIIVTGTNRPFQRLVSQTDGTKHCGIKAEASPTTNGVIVDSSGQPGTYSLNLTFINI